MIIFNEFYFTEKSKKTDLVAQSLIPRKPLSSFPCFMSSFWFCMSSFTLSMGAADVFEMAAAVPERKKLSVKPNLVLEDEGEVAAAAAAEDEAVEDILEREEGS